MGKRLVHPLLDTYETEDRMFIIDPFRGDNHVSAHIARITADGGYIHSTAFLSDLIRDLKHGSSAAGDCYSLLDGLWIAGCVKKDGSDKVSKLYDISPPKGGSYYDASQSNASLQQPWTSSGLDSQPEIAFDQTKGAYTTSSVPSAAQPHTVFAITKNTNVSSAARIIENSGLSLYYDNTAHVVMYGGSPVFITSTNNTYGFHTALFNGADSTLRSNRAEIGTGDVGALSNSGVRAIGGSASNTTMLNGALVMVAVVRQSITTTQRDHIESTIDSRWPSTV